MQRERVLSRSKQAKQSKSASFLILSFFLIVFYVSGKCTFVCDSKGYVKVR